MESLTVGISVRVVPWKERENRDEDSNIMEFLTFYLFIAIKLCLRGQHEYGVVLSGHSRDILG